MYSTHFVRLQSPDLTLVRLVKPYSNIFDTFFTCFDGTVASKFVPLMDCLPFVTA
jgi:hypothetical protein